MATETLTPEGHYVAANGLTMYYEEHGAGPPLVLVHGGLVTSASWTACLPAFAEHFRVLAPDSRGHGRTDNPTGVYSYRLMADDLAAFIGALGLERPLVCGYSDGGQIALELGMRHPDLAGALVLGAAWFEFSETYRATVAHLGFEAPGVVHVEQMEQAMPDLVGLMRAWHAPRQGPEYWKALAVGLSTPWLTPLDYTAEDFAAVTAPTLVVVGDHDDLVPVEEAVRMYRLLPQAELAVCPASDHLFPFTRPDRFTASALDFLLRYRPDVGPA